MKGKEGDFKGRKCFCGCGSQAKNTALWGRSY